MTETCCNNCGKYGHLFYQCKFPIISYGIILFQYNTDGELEFLMIRRKDSFGYSDYMVCKHSPHFQYRLQQIVDEMSLDEKRKLSIDCNSMVGVAIANSSTQWKETEWEFPKGRKNNICESGIACALREFEEETGISKTQIQLIQNIIPFEETFIGSNGKAYKHKYFLAYTNSPCNLSHYQRSEVSNLQWKTLSDCLQSIRPYCVEKKQLITTIYTLLTKYKLYVL